MRMAAGLVTALVVLLGLGIEGRQADMYCGGSASLCELVPRDPSGEPLYNTGQQPGMPFVIGKNASFSYTPTTPAPGKGQLPWPAMFIIENATVTLSDGSPGTEVLLTALTILCDHSRLVVENTAVRINQTVPQENPILGFGFSSVSYGADVSINTVSSRVSQATPSQLLQVMFDNSTSVATEPIVWARGMGIDGWELAALDSSTVSVSNQVRMTAETYVGQHASLTLTNSSYFDVFFENCAGQSLSLPTLPALCSLTNTSTKCFTANHPFTTFSLQPPQATYSFQAVKSRLWALAVTAHSQSRLSVGSASADAHFNIGLPELAGQLTVKATVGMGGHISGITDRSIELGPGVNLGGWMLWFDSGAPGNTTFHLLPGSTVGDVALPNGAEALLESSLLGSGQLMVPTGSRVLMQEVDNSDRTYVQPDGKLIVIDSRSSSTMSVAGSVWFMGTTADALKVPELYWLPTGESKAPVVWPLTLLSGRVLFGGLLSPKNGTSLSRHCDSAVLGAVNTVTPTGPAPFAATLKFTDSQGKTVTLAHLVKAVPFGKIGNVACSSMSAGWGELVLSFDDEEKAAVTVALRIAVL